MNHHDHPSRTSPPSRTRVLVPRQSQSGVNIPSSAVIGIGLGFVAFAIAILALLMSIRIFRIQRRVRIAQRNGRPQTTFRSLWREEGGFFGFLTGQGDGLAVGAGAAADVTRIRRMLEEYRRWQQVLEQEPEMHDVEVLPKGAVAQMAVAMNSLVPLAIQSSPHPPITERPRPPNEQSSPEFYLHLLISMPSKPPPPVKRLRLSEEEEFDDLPEVAIGSTAILPMLHERTPSTRVPGADWKDGRRIRWQAAEGGKWNFEGLG